MKSVITRYVYSFMAAICGLVLCSGNQLHAAEPQELVFLTWSEYMDPALITKFETQYNARIKFIYFESDELRDDMLLNTDGSGYDVICSNGRSIKSYVHRDWLAGIAEQDVPNKKYINPRWARAYPYAKDYAIPFFWGSVGIAYRKDLVKIPVTSWKQLLNPSEELKGKIQLVKDARDLMAIALKSLGQSVNTSNLKVLDQAESLLLTQKPYVKDYSYISLSSESSLVKGSTLAAMSYNGDALKLAEHNKDIVYVIPDEGTSLWIDYLVVTKKSKRKKLAMEFLNFLNQPENAAQLAQYVYYATPNNAAEKLLPQEFLNDPVIYPSQAVIDQSEFYRILSPRTQKRYNSILPHVINE